ncbi:MAG: hypothetical protein P8Z68_06410 [Kineosporiaceae bacterium]
MTVEDPSQLSPASGRRPVWRRHVVWGSLAAVATVLGLAMITIAGGWVRAVAHRESQVCAPISAVPLHVPGGLFPLYWGGVAAVGVASVTAMLAGFAQPRGGPARRRDRAGRWVYGTGTAVLALAAVGVAVWVESLPAAVLLAVGAAGALVATIRARPGAPGAHPARRGRGPWWLAAAVLALVCLVLAGQVPQMHYSIRISRELCNGGFG